MTDAEQFLESVIRNFEENPSDVSFLFHAEGSLQLPGMDEPIPMREIPAMVAKQRAAIPDVTYRITDWAERDGVIFYEWESTGTIGRQQVTWRGVNRNRLRGARSLGAVAYFDRMSLLEAAGLSKGENDLGSAMDRMIERKEVGRRSSSRS